MVKLFYFSNLKWLLVSLLVVLLDIFTKRWVLYNCVFGQPIFIFPFINLYCVYNFGIAFSLFSTFGVERNSVLLCLIVLIILVLIVMLCLLDSASRRNFFVKLSYAIVIGGALGNVIDRIYYGAVIDFIDIHIANYHWPTFNVADLGIFFGVFSILYLRG